MNQTQRKFALRLAGEVLLEKLKVAEAADKAAIHERNLFVNGSVHIQKAILSGELKPYAKTAKRPFDGVDTNLSAFFDIPSFVKKRNALADKKGMLTAQGGNGQHQFKTKEHCESWYPWYHSATFLAKVDVAQTKYNEIERELILGSSEEAKEMLDALKDFTL